MKKLNNKGYVLSIMLFGILILFITVFSTLILTMNNSFKLDNTLKQSIIDDIESPDAPKKVCRRATELHTEVCEQTDAYGCIEKEYVNGDTIVYGNDPATRVTGTLTSGDAFDCDVNADGTYDKTTERFYYVTDLETDPENYAVLIYYNNVSGGEANSASTYAYVSKDDYIAAGGTEEDYGSYGNWNKGPLTIVKQLPSVSKWNRVRLFESSKNIKDETGTEKISNFSYDGYAARLLTVQEVNKACGITIGSYKDGEIDQCKYLMENTYYSNSGLPYGYWLESTNSTYEISAWLVYSFHRRVDYFIVSNGADFGVRPVIEVLKSDISY